MNLGQLSNINEDFINNYKKYGYKTKTQLANEAISLLRQAKAREKRMNWLNEGFEELAGTEPDVAFEAIEGEDFK
ncbi:MAG: hypothetical protein HQK54_05590 [Oligoflexales bacterium]|nr:hypothetical protein [Oligoflexales bacterium]